MAAPALILLTSAATPRTADTVAASNIQTQMGSAFNQLYQAYQACYSTMWSSSGSTHPQGIANALGTYASDWVSFMSLVCTMLNDYVLVGNVVPNFIPADKTIVTNSDGTITITPNSGESGV